VHSTTDFVLLAAPWREATITPSELTVGSKNELEWSLRLPNGQQLLPRDCIEFEVSAPQASASGYQSFNPNEFKDEAPKCDVSTPVFNIILI
jgi:hypothetical protein